MENIEQLKSLLSLPKEILITGHRNPDGDAIGASLGLYFFLKKFGHNIHLVTPSEYPYFLSWMPDIDNYLVYDTEQEEVDNYIAKADIVFCLDYNSLERVDKLGIALGESKATMVLIDHHPEPEPFADFVLSVPSASSTAEVIYDFIHLLKEENKIDKRIAECIYTGILSDTASFKYGTSSELFTKVAQIIDYGVNNEKIQNLLYNELSEKHLRLLGHCLHNRMEIIDEFHTGIIYLTKEDYKEFDISRGDTEGIVNYLLMIKNVKVAAFIHEQPTIVKISLRSKGDFSVHEIAKKHFNGGGHKNASGGYTFVSLDVAIKRFKSILPRYF